MKTRQTIETTKWPRSLEVSRMHMDGEKPRRGMEKGGQDIDTDTTRYLFSRWDWVFACSVVRCTAVRRPGRKCWAWVTLQPLWKCTVLGIIIYFMERDSFLDDCQMVGMVLPAQWPISKFLCKFLLFLSPFERKSEVFAAKENITRFMLVDDLARATLLTHFSVCWHQNFCLLLPFYKS